MRKRKFFLFLLFPVVCGTVNVKAQVRIGGDNIPHSSAVLDLNPSDTEDAQGGLLLPYVRLSSTEDITVFGADSTVTEGLMVYNLNDNDSLRPEKGVYCYTGEKWLPLGIRKYVERKPDFSISVTPKRRWLGRGEGELTKVDISIPEHIIDYLSNYKMGIKYRWFLTDVVRKEEVEITTLEPSLQISAEQRDTIKKHTVYQLSVAVRIPDYYETARVDAGYVVYGTGAWVGTNQWLIVANANVGANQSLSLEQQLSKDHTIYNPDIVGGYFQWGRLSDGHDSLRSLTYDSPVPKDMLDPRTGQPTDTIISPYYGKFIKAGQSDWREYYYSDGDVGIINESRKPWYWRTMEDAGIGSNPCDTVPGEWFVMTRSQLDSIIKYNNREWLDTDSVRGIAIYPDEDPDEDSDNFSFYFPKTASRSSISGRLDASEGDSDRTVSLWLNSTDSFNLENAIMLTGLSNKKEPLYNNQPRAEGAPIRCVSQEF